MKKVHRQRFSLHGPVDIRQYPGLLKDQECLGVPGAQDTKLFADRKVFTESCHPAAISDFRPIKKVRFSS